MAHELEQVAFDGRPSLWWGLMGMALLLLCTTVAGAAPANDEMATAAVITVLPFTDGPLDTTTATTAADDPDSCGGGPTVWYVVTPATDLSIIVGTFGSDYDTTVSVYTGVPGALTQFDCNDDYFEDGYFYSLQSRVVFSAVAGTTYYIMVGSWASGLGGSLLFHVVDELSLGASVSGIIPHTAVCKNITTEQQVTLSHPASTWDCEAAGLPVSSGDRVAMRVQGTVEESAMDVSGVVSGLAPTSGGCTNLTTGQQVKFQDMRGATAASCAFAGLVVQAGHTVQMSVQGTTE